MRTPDFTAALALEMLKLGFASFLWLDCFHWRVWYRHEYLSDQMYMPRRQLQRFVDAFLRCAVASWCTGCRGMVLPVISPAFCAASMDRDFLSGAWPRGGECFCPGCRSFPPRPAQPRHTSRVRCQAEGAENGSLSSSLRWSSCATGTSGGGI
eukprot:9471390-Pyramimonas_sp.AAC.3